MEKDTDKSKGLIGSDRNVPNKEYEESKTFIKTFIKWFVITIGICFVLSNTIPSYELHRTTISKYVSNKSEVGKKLIGNNKDDQSLRYLIDKGVENLMFGVVSFTDFRVDDYKICSVGSVTIDGKRKIVSVGILGKVFVLYKD